MRMRQFVFVAEELQPAADEICDVLGLKTCYQDPGVGHFGLENYLIPINGNLIEVVAPKEEGTTAGRYLARRGGPGGYMVITQCEDAVAERERIAAMGIRIVWQTDDEDVQATHFHPADVPGAILSIDTMNPGENWHDETGYWRWAGPDWQKDINTDVSQALTAIEFQADDPAALAKQWAEVLNCPLGVGATGDAEVSLDNMKLRFVKAEDDRGVGISAIDILPQNRPAILAAAEKRGLKRGDSEVELCGLKVNLI
jgi:Glyoxalase-like domain